MDLDWVKYSLQKTFGEQGGKSGYGQHRFYLMVICFQMDNGSMWKNAPFGRTDAEAEAPILWPPDVKS